MLHDGQGHQCIERAPTLCREHLYWNTMYRDVAQYVKDCSQCQETKDPHCRS